MAAALACLAHRGPDDRGLWDDEVVTVGHRRLSIVDLRGSRQPMVDRSGRWVLTYNGEIYNYRELRRELEPRWTFSTRGDTEVLLAGLALEGPRFLERAEGMWAFALWDRLERRLLLGRDRFGKKPLYYRLLPGGLCVASELAALAALDPSCWEEDLDSTADYFRYGFYLPGTTAYRGVREVLPGHTARWAEGTLSQEPYWRLPTGPFAGSKADAIAALRERLEASVRLRLVADVEVGAFLSGGVDSSLVSALAARELAGDGRRLKTFTIGFSEWSFDERAYARLAARHVGSEHVEEVLPGWDEGRLEELLLRHLGQPFGDSSILPTTLVSEVASRHVKVALSGDGGDELFSGYQRYQARVLLRWYLATPSAARAAVERVVRALPEPAVHHSRSLLKKAHLFVRAARRADPDVPELIPRLFTEPELARLVPDLARRGHRPPALPEAPHLDDVLRMMAMDALVYLPQDILVKVDRASMACSLEARAPFLDSRLASLAFAVPRRWHRRGGRGKCLLREAFRDLLPPAIWRRRKQGFGVPLGTWFRGTLGDALLQLAGEDPGPVAPTELRALLAEHRAGAADNGLRLWPVYAYLLWRRHGGRPHGEVRPSGRGAGP